MRRITLWFLGTVAVVTLLFGYHTPTSGATPMAGETVVAAPAAPQQAAAATFTGSVVQTRWGPVQVTITVAGGKITAVDVPQYPDGNRRDQEINAEALPILTQATLYAQSANIDMISGATVSCDGYVESLQSAIDQAGLA